MIHFLFYMTLQREFSLNLIWDSRGGIWRQKSGQVFSGQVFNFLFLQDFYRNEDFLLLIAIDIYIYIYIKANDLV